MSTSTTDALSAFNKFNDLLAKKTKGHVKLKGFSDIDEFIPTGNYMLNALMSGSLFGGYPNARSVGIAGESGCLPKTQKVKIYKLKHLSDVQKCRNISSPQEKEIL
jgi:hypothetical protein